HDGGKVGEALLVSCSLLKADYDQALSHALPPVSRPRSSVAILAVTHLPLFNNERFNAGAKPCAIRPTPAAIANRATVQHLIIEALKPRLAAHVWKAQERRWSPPPRCRP